MESISDDVNLHISADPLDAVVQRLTDTATSRLAFGEPIDRDGVTVVPAAVTAWGFGRGGVTAGRLQGPSGGAGGVRVKPAGFIEISNGRARYHAAIDWTVAAPIGLSAFSFGLVIGMLMRRR